MKTRPDSVPARKVLVRPLVSPRIRAESEIRIVCPRDRFLRVSHTKKCGNRAEDFLARRRRIWRDINENCRFVEKAAPSIRSAPQELGAGCHRRFHLLIDSAQNLFVRQRTDVSRLVERIADF